jgi:CheY-like chemotaxis protein
VPISSGQTPRGTETILLAEDNEGLREAAREMLEGLGYRVILASDGGQAVQLFKTNADRIDLAILDVVMPGLTGPDAYLQISIHQASTPVIFTTGYTAEAASLNSLVDKDALFLQKPYSLKSLGQMIRRVLDRRQSPRNSVQT